MAGEVLYYILAYFVVQKTKKEQVT